MLGLRDSYLHILPCSPPWPPIGGYSAPPPLSRHHMPCLAQGYIFNTKYICACCFVEQRPYPQSQTLSFSGKSPSFRSLRISSLTPPPPPPVRVCRMGWVYMLHMYRVYTIYNPGLGNEVSGATVDCVVYTVNNLCTVLSFIASS